MIKKKRGEFHSERGLLDTWKYIILYTYADANILIEGR